jgi:hypothetical protein
MNDAVSGFIGVLAEHEGWVLTGVGVAAAAWIASVWRRARAVARKAWPGGRSADGPAVPVATFLESWSMLERVVSEAAQRTGCDAPAPDRATELHRNGIITEEQLQSHERLKRCADRLRSQANPPVSPREIRELVMDTLDLTRDVYHRSILARGDQAAQGS